MTQTSRIVGRSRMWRIRCSVCQARCVRSVVSRRLRGRRRGSGRLALAAEGELRASMSIDRPVSAGGPGVQPNIARPGQLRVVNGQARAQLPVSRGPPPAPRPQGLPQWRCAASSCAGWLPGLVPTGACPDSSLARKGPPPTDSVRTVACSQATPHRLLFERHWHLPRRKRH